MIESNVVCRMNLPLPFGYLFMQECYESVCIVIQKRGIEQEDNKDPEYQRQSECIKQIITNEEKEVYEVISETRGPKYTVNFEDETCTCADFVNRGDVCKHFYKIVMEKAIAVTEEQILDIRETLFYGQPEQVVLALQIFKEEDEEA